VHGFLFCLLNDSFVVFESTLIMAVIEDKSAPGTVILLIQTVGCTSSILKPHRMSFSFPFPPYLPHLRTSPLCNSFLHVTDPLLTTPKPPLAGHASEGPPNIMHSHLHHMMLLPPQPSTPSPRPPPKRPISPFSDLESGQEPCSSSTDWDGSSGRSLISDI
jgi:hypothetical protein